MTTPTLPIQETDAERAHFVREHLPKGGLFSGHDWRVSPSPFRLGAEMLNFGALIAFMGVNLAAFMRYFVRQDKKQITNFIFPLAGFFICLLLWLNLSRPAKIVGAIWMGVGIAFGAIKTKGFRGNLIDFELPPEED